MAEPAEKGIMSIAAHSGTDDAGAARLPMLAPPLAALPTAPPPTVGRVEDCALAPLGVGLVYLAGPALDEGQSLKGILARRAPPEGSANNRQDNYRFLWIAPEKFTRPSVMISTTRQNR